jgi:hypothetical protein
MNDLRSAVRSLRATPIVTSVAVLSLALGIGATTVIFSLTNSLLLRKLPVRDPGALVLVTDPTVPGVRAYALGVWESFRRFVDVFDGTLAWSSTEFNLVPRGEAQIVSGAWVSGSYFETLGISALLGRVCSPNPTIDGTEALTARLPLSLRLLAAAVRRRTGCHRPLADAQWCVLHSRWGHAEAFRRL